MDLDAEREMIQRCRSGEDDAWEELFAEQYSLPSNMWQQGVLCSNPPRTFRVGTAMRFIRSNGSHPPVKPFR